jgi:hypothetical protein
MEGHDLSLPSVRQRAEQDGVHDTEDRGVGPDAEGEGQDHCGREAPRRAQAPEAVPDVLEDVFEEAHAPRLAAFLLDPLEAAQAHEREPPRFVGRNPAAEVFLGLHLEVEAELVIHPLLEPVAVE